MARIRITRTLVFEGDEEWVRNSMNPDKAIVSPDKPFIAGKGVILEKPRVEEELHG